MGRPESLQKSLSQTKRKNNPKNEISEVSQIINIPLSELSTPDNHPFLVWDDDAMQRLAESVKADGVREPGIARRIPVGGYELLSGNRRKRACELAGLNSMPVIVRELTDEEATVLMVDSNLQHRERILPSEKAWAYKVKMEALNHSGIKGEQYSYEIMEEQTGESKTQIFRTIRLTELVNVLLDKLDTGKLSFSPAVELTFLSYDEQHYVADCMERYEVKPSLSIAVKLRKAKQSGSLTLKLIDEVLSRGNTSESPALTRKSSANEFRKYFPPGYTNRQINEAIIKLLEARKTHSRTA